MFNRKSARKTCTDEIFCDTNNIHIMCYNTVMAELVACWFFLQGAKNSMLHRLVVISTYLCGSTNDGLVDVISWRILRIFLVLYPYFIGWSSVNMEPALPGSSWESCRRRPWSPRWGWCRGPGTGPRSPTGSSQRGRGIPRPKHEILVPCWICVERLRMTESSAKRSYLTKLTCKGRYGGGVAKQKEGHRDNVHKAGRKYQHDWLYLQSLNSIKHK